MKFLFALFLCIALANGQGYVRYKIFISGNVKETKQGYLF